MDIKKALIDGQEIEYDAWTASYTNWLEDEFKQAGRTYIGQGYIIWDDGEIGDEVRHFWKKSEQMQEVQQEDKSN